MSSAGGGYEEATPRVREEAAESERLSVACAPSTKVGRSTRFSRRSRSLSMTKESKCGLRSPKRIADPMTGNSAPAGGEGAVT